VSEEPTAGDIDRLTIIDILHLLGRCTPSTLASIFGLLITALAFAFGLGARISQWYSNPDLVPCSNVANYPMGKWLVSGVDKSGLNAALNDHFLMTTPQTATTFTREVAQTPNQIKFQSPLKNGQSISYSGSDGKGYDVYFEGRVSSSGCSMEGTWSDSKKQGGTVTYFWYEPRDYWVKQR
jgi:hypothetical protein